MFNYHKAYINDIMSIAIYGLYEVKKHVNIIMIMLDIYNLKCVFSCQDIYVFGGHNDSYDYNTFSDLHKFSLGKIYFRTL